MVSEREYRFAKAIVEILNNHRNWTTDSSIELLSEIIVEDHMIAARLWFDAERAIKEFPDG
jgi:hypothetical protein